MYPTLISGFFSGEIGFMKRKENKLMTTKTITFRRDSFRAVTNMFSVPERLSVRGGEWLDSLFYMRWPADDREIGRSRRICSAFSKLSRVHGRSILL